MIFVDVTVVAIILSVLILLLLLLLFLPISVVIDSEVPHAFFQYKWIGEGWIWYEDEWWLSFRIFFFKKKMLLSGIKRNKRQIEKKPGLKRKNNTLSFKKVLRITRTFRIREWKIGIDTGDHALTAQLYPLNFVPSLFRHVRINFTGENYLFIKMDNNAWRILYAYLR